METFKVFYPYLLLVGFIIGVMFFRNWFISVRNNAAGDEGEAVPDPQKEYAYGTCPACSTKLYKDHVRYELPPKISEGRRERVAPQCLFSCPCGRSIMLIVPIQQVQELREMIEFRRLQALQMQRTGSGTI